MKYVVVALCDEEVYVAQLGGPSVRYRYQREFLKAVEQPLRSHKGSGPRVRHQFDLEPAIYEQSVDGEQLYFAVVGRKVVGMEQELVERLNRLCSKYNYSWPWVVEQWMSSKDRGVTGLAKLIAECKRDEEAEQREEREERKLWLQQRVKQVSAVEVFYDSDPALTRRFLLRLEKLGCDGQIAAELFRAQKASTRAKGYRGRYRGYAYERKSEVLDKLSARLESAGRFRWGWRIDPCQPYAPWVLYVDLPQGQVSFHARLRGDGPDYPGDWDRQHVSAERILAFCDRLLHIACEAA